MVCPFVLVTDAYTLPAETLPEEGNVRHAALLHHDNIGDVYVTSVDTGKLCMPNYFCTRTLTLWLSSELHLVSVFLTRGFTLADHYFPKLVFPG